MLADLLSIDVPVVQAPMAGVQGSAMAIAVSNAGGLGSLPCAMLGPDAIRAELVALASAGTKPYNVNFFCHEQPVPDPAGEARWRSLLAPYFIECGIDPASIPSGPGRVAFNHAAADVLEEFKPPIVSFHFGLPADDLVSRVKRMGARVLASATTIDEARFLETRGVDAIIAQGLEAGGHRGIFLSDDLTTQIGTLALVRQMVKAVSVPVIAAGGIADAEGVAAAMTLGAAGVQVGTAYLLCPEATTSAVHRAALKAGSHTAVTNLFTGRPARGIVNRLMREIGPLHPDVPKFPMATAAILALRSKAESQGSGDFSGMWAGQNISGCREVSAATITRELAAGVVGAGG